MGEERFELRPYGVRCRCECGGEIQAVRIEVFSEPIKFPHICNDCGEKVYLAEKFPTVRYEYAPSVERKSEGLRKRNRRLILDSNNTQHGMSKEVQQMIQDLAEEAKWEIGRRKAKLNEDVRNILRAAGALDSKRCD